MNTNFIQYMMKKSGMATVGLILFTSCTGNFESLNTHPTDIYDDMLTSVEKVGALFPTMTYLLHPAQENQNQGLEQMLCGQYGGYWATTNNWSGTNFGTLNPSGVWIDDPYKLLFTNFYPNYQTVKNTTGGTGYIYDWVQIIRVAVMQRVADIYGPIPYTQMGKGEFQVAYDDVQTLYHTMIGDLTTSIENLKLFMQENKNTSLPIAQYDVMYNGDFSKWIKFANSLKFRMAVRIAQVDTEFAKKAMKEAMESGMIEDNTDNAFLPTNDNPYYKSAFKWGDVAINASLSSYMSGYKDPRIDKYMTKTSDNTYCGVRMGIKNIDQATYSSDRFSKPAFQQNSSLPVFYASETSFLRAEAALQGWIDGGEAEAKRYYEQGIQLSMDQYGVGIGNYLSSTDIPNDYTDPANGSNQFAFKNPVTVAWDNGSNKLEKIITQKWIANFPIGMEAWADFRRTGYPQFITPLDNLSNSGSLGVIDSKRMVRRLSYPTTEKSSNKENVEHAIATMLEGQPDLGSSDLWWAKKN